MIIEKCKVCGDTDGMPCTLEGCSFRKDEPAPVEQAGGDERAAFEAWLAQAMSKKFEPEFDLAKYEDSGEYRYSPAAAYWKAWQARAALAQPSGEVVVTKNESGAIVSVTRQDKEGRVLSVIAESQHSPAQAEQAEVKRLREENANLILTCASLDSEKREMQHKWDAIIAERDAALARVAELEHVLRVVVNAADHGSWPTTVMHGIEKVREVLAGSAPPAKAQHIVPVVTPEMVMAAMAVFRLDVSPFKSMEAALIAALRKAAAPGKDGDE